MHVLGLVDTFCPMVYTTSWIVQRFLGNLAKIGRQASDYYACALLEISKLHSDLERTLEK